jgi:uncharacterized protein YdeI (YjbR/CyaY-like superfamily)
VSYPGFIVRNHSVRFASRHDFDAWLDEHAATSEGVWLELAKKGAAAATLSYAEAIEVALCHGWIDGQKRAHDDEVWLQRFTRRTPRSRWSRINRDKATALIEQGSMKPAGHAAIEQAKADGRWERAYAGARTVEVPDDLRRRLDETPAAAAFFAELDGANRYAVLYRIHEAVRPETRARRIENFVAMLARGEKPHGD